MWKQRLLDSVTEGTHRFPFPGDRRFSINNARSPPSIMVDATPPSYPTILVSLWKQSKPHPEAYQAEINRSSKTNWKPRGTCYFTLFSLPYSAPKEGHEPQRPLSWVAMDSAALPSGTTCPNLRYFEPQCNRKFSSAPLT